MNSLKGTKTEQNLMKAFAGESQARTRYTFYASAAAKEGYVQIANIFTETANNEKEHAKRFFKFLNVDLNGEAVTINASYPVALGDTKTNLSAAAKGENEEWTKLYPSFAQTAREEGFEPIAAAFEVILQVEKHHEQRYRKLISNLQSNTVFKKDKVVLWKCINCGYIFEGMEAPKVCPSCLHPQSYFELLAENY
ncbi:MAG: rubrerythrin family protein [Clostridium sp.]|nr:rubrerythrin family protein [Clostridium sp.]